MTSKLETQADYEKFRDNLNTRAQAFFSKGSFWNGYAHNAQKLHDDHKKLVRFAESASNPLPVDLSPATAIRFPGGPAVSLPEAHMAAISRDVEQVARSFAQRDKLHGFHDTAAFHVERARNALSAAYQSLKSPTVADKVRSMLGIHRYETHLKSAYGHLRQARRFADGGDRQLAAQGLLKPEFLRPGIPADTTGDHSWAVPIRHIPNPTGNPAYRLKMEEQAKLNDAHAKVLLTRQGAGGSPAAAVALPSAPASLAETTRARRD